MNICAISTQMNKNVVQDPHSHVLTAIDNFKHFILLNAHKYYYFLIQFVVCPLINFVIKPLLKNMSQRWSLYS